MALPKIYWTLSGSIRRVLDSAPSIIQIVAAATLAYSISFYFLGHVSPLFSVTVAIASLGFTRDARFRRVFETTLGILVGIILAEILLTVLGAGIWQLALVLMISLTAARFITGTPAFAITVGIQAMLVYIMPVPEGGPFIRSIDGAIGAAVALLFTAFVPRDPIGSTSKDAGKLFTVFISAVDALRSSVQTADHKIADDALARMRGSQPLVDNWRMSLDSAVSVSKISPLMRRYRADLADQLLLLQGMDLATRNLRVFVRRVDFLIRDGKSRPYLAELLAQISAATSRLAKGLYDTDSLPQAQKMFLSIIRQLDPRKFGIEGDLREASVLLLLRPLLVDLLTASGMNEDEARAELPEI